MSRGDEMKKSLGFLGLLSYLLILFPYPSSAANLLPDTATDYPNMVLIGTGIFAVGLLLLSYLWWRDRY